jgi:hypothetical protein
MLRASGTFNINIVRRSAKIAFLHKPSAHCENAVFALRIIFMLKADIEILT